MMEDLKDRRNSKNGSFSISKGDKRHAVNSEFQNMMIIRLH